MFMDDETIEVGADEEVVDAGTESEEAEVA